MNTIDTETYRDSLTTLLRNRNGSETMDDPKYVTGAQRVLDFMHDNWQRQKLCDVVISTNNGDLQVSLALFQASERQGGAMGALAPRMLKPPWRKYLFSYPAQCFPRLRGLCSSNFTKLPKSLYLSNLFISAVRNTRYIISTASRRIRTSHKRQSRRVELETLGIAESLQNRQDGHIPNFKFWGGTGRTGESEERVERRGREGERIGGEGRL